MWRTWRLPRQPPWDLPHRGGAMRLRWCHGRSFALRVIARILIDNLDAIRSWVESMRWHAEDLLYKQAGYGDWIAPEASLMESIGTAYFYVSTWILSKIAGILGERDDVWEYGELAEQIAEAYNAAYFDEATRWYAGRTQTGQVLPLAFGICPESARARVASRLVEDIHTRTATM